MAPRQPHPLKSALALSLAATLALALGCDKGGAKPAPAPAPPKTEGIQPNTQPETGGELAQPELPTPMIDYPVEPAVAAAIEYAVANATPADPARTKNAADKIAQLVRMGRCILNPGTTMEGMSCNAAYGAEEATGWIAESLTTVDTYYADAILAQDPAKPSERVSDAIRAISNAEVPPEEETGVFSKVPQVIGILDALAKRLGAPAAAEPPAEG